MTPQVGNTLEPAGTLVYYLLASGSFGGFPVSRGARDPIRTDEIARTFSDAAVAKLARRAGLRRANFKELAAGIRASVEQYAKEVRLATPNTVHREIEGLVQAAARRDYPKLRENYANLSNDARQPLEDRVQRIRDRAPTEDQKLYWALPELAELDDPCCQSAAAEAILRIATIGWSKDGWILYAPEPSKSEPRREAERTFVRWLQVAYSRATGRMPPNTGQHYRPGPFPRMVAECLRLARAPSSDPDDDRAGLAVQLINDLDRERRYANNVWDLRCILGPLRREYPVIDCIVGLVEDGQADVRRIPRWAGADQVVGPPSLIEFEETGTICFYLRPEDHRTLAIEPFARARIMDIANSLKALATPRRRRLTGPRAVKGVAVRRIRGAEGWRTTTS
jgi:hypothetical protein